MSVDKRDTDRGGNRGTANSDRNEAKEQLQRRTTAFGVAIVILGVVAVWFVATTFSSRRGQGEVTLSAPIEHTVKILELPSSRRDDVRRMAKNPVLRELTQGHELYVREVSDDKIALCAGHFESANSDDALRLMEKLEQFERKNRRPFKSAQLLKIRSVQ